MMIFTRTRLLVKEFEIIFSFLVFLIYGAGIFFVISRLSHHIAEENSLQWLASPTNIQFILVPSYLFLLYRHDSYTFNLYCMIRTNSKTELLFIRFRDIVIETIAFLLPLLILFIIICAVNNISFPIVIAYFFVQFFWFVFIGTICIFFSRLFKKNYYGYLIVYTYLMFDALATIGFFHFDYNVLYSQILAPLFSDLRTIDMLKQAGFILTECVLWLVLIHTITNGLCRKEEL